MLICAPEKKDMLLLKIASLYPQNHISELKGIKRFVIHFPVVYLNTLEHIASPRSSPLQGFLSSSQQLLRADPRGRLQTPVQSSS